MSEQRQNNAALDLDGLLALAGKAKGVGKLETRQDPTELRCRGIFYRHEYEPNEFACAWFARELLPANAEYAVAACNAVPELIRRVREAEAENRRLSALVNSLTAARKEEQ